MFSTALPIISLRIIVAIVMVLGGACGNEERIAVFPASVGDIRTSSILSVPLHTSAVLDPEQSTQTREIYRVALPLRGLANFYHYSANLGSGSNFGEFQWCSGTIADEPIATFESVWRKPVMADFLVIRGVATDGNHSMIEIIEERGNAARQCGS